MRTLLALGMHGCSPHPEARAQAHGWLPGLGQSRTGLLLALAVLLAGALARRAPTVQVAEVREARPGEQQTELSAAGYVDSRRRSVLAPIIPGRLDAVLVEEGDVVEEGQVVARLDDRDARAALQQARAEVDRARG